MNKEKTREKRAVKAALLIIVAAAGIAGFLGATGGTGKAVISALAVGNGLLAEYRYLNGTYIKSVIGEGPIRHGCTFECPAAQNTKYEDSCALWAGIFNGWSQFEETLTGYIEAPQTGTFEISGTTDDDHIVTFQDVIVSEYHGNYGWYIFNADLIEGQFYKIQIVYKNKGGSNYLSLDWLRPDGVSENIPKKHLYTDLPLMIVSLDVKPGSYPNPINLKSKGVTPVAVLTSETFNAEAVDVATLLFGKTGIEAAPVHFAWEDVDGDGDFDLILHFDTQQTGFQPGDTTAILTGKTQGGMSIKGTDSIQTVPKK